MKAYCLIETRAGTTKEVGKKLKIMKNPHVISVEAITGPYDFLVVLMGPNLDVIIDAVVGPRGTGKSIGEIDGVTRTTICVAVSFRT